MVFEKVQIRHVVSGTYKCELIKIIFHNTRIESFTVVWAKRSWPIPAEYQLTGMKLLFPLGKKVKHGMNKWKWWDYARSCAHVSCGSASLHYITLHYSCNVHNLVPSKSRKIRSLQIPILILAVSCFISVSLKRQPKPNFRYACYEKYRTWLV